MASLHASAALVSSRGALVATGGLDWAQLGVDGASVVTPANANTSISGLSATITNPGGLGGSFTRFNEGAGTWAGNFASGDALLSTFEVGGSISIAFNAGISRIGAQIQGFDYAAFTGLISAYDASNTLLESYSGADPSVDANADNFAMFLGISRATADIARVVFDIDDPDLPWFAINRLSLSQVVDPSQPPTVPEPGSLALVALSLAGLGAMQRRSKR